MSTGRCAELLEMALKTTLWLKYENAVKCYFFMNGDGTELILVNLFTLF